MFDPWRKKNIPSNVTSGRNCLWKKRSYLVCVSAQWINEYSVTWTIFLSSLLPLLLKKKDLKKKESITQSNLIKKWKQSRGLHLICPLKCGGLFKRRAGTRTDKGPFYRSLTPSHLIEFFPRYRNESEQIHTHELDAEGVASDQFCWSPPRDSELSWNMPAWQSVCTAPFDSASNYCTKGFK